MSTSPRVTAFNQGIEPRPPVTTLGARYPRVLEDRYDLPTAALGGCHQFASLVLGRCSFLSIGRGFAPRILQDPALRRRPFALKGHRFSGCGVVKTTEGAASLGGRDGRGAPIGKVRDDHEKDTTCKRRIDCARNGRCWRSRSTNEGATSKVIRRRKARAMSKCRLI